MATLQKFKILATQCAVAGSPTRSPTTSPVIHIRRRKTLRMLLGRGAEGSRLPPRCDNGSPDRMDSSEKECHAKEGKELSVSHKLKDLFMSPPPSFGEQASENVKEGLLPSYRDGMRRDEIRSLRPLSATVRQRLLRRAWRPVLGAIPE